MPPTTRGTTAPRLRDNAVNLMASDPMKNSPQSLPTSPNTPNTPNTPNSPTSEFVSLPTPTRARRRKPQPEREDEYMQFAREMLADDTEAALNYAGYQRDSSLAPEYDHLCTCGLEVATDEEVDMDGMIRCANRQCSPGWFHLSCVKLPDHPPGKFIWFCKRCLKACKIEGAISGMICQRGEFGSQEIRDWCTEQKQNDRRCKARQLNKRKKTASFTSESESSD